MPGFSYFEQGVVKGMNNARRRSPLMRRQAAYGIAYITPGMLIVMAFCIVPIFMTLYYSFTKYNLAQPPEFLAFENYQKLFTNSQLRKALWNTVIYVIITVPLQTMLAMFVERRILHLHLLRGHNEHIRRRPRGVDHRRRNAQAEVLAHNRTAAQAHHVHERDAGHHLVLPGL